MSISKISSRKTPAQNRTRPDESEEPGAEQAPKIVFSMIRSPSSSFKAQAPAQPILKSALKESKSKSAVKSAQSGKSSKSATKDSGKRTPLAHVSYFSPHRPTREEEEPIRVRSGVSSVDKSHTKRGRDYESVYHQETARKSSYDLEQSRRSTPGKFRGDDYEYSGHEDIHNRSHKYSIEEDLEILDYVRSRPNGNYTSKAFWTQAVEEDNLLGRARSVESVRERYRSHLRHLTEDEVRKLLWHYQHGDKGYAHYETRPLKDERGKIHHVKKFEGIDPAAGSYVCSDIASRRKRSASKDSILAIDSKEGVLKPAEDFEEEIVYEPIGGRKRKGYDAMHYVDERILPRKNYWGDYYEEEEIGRFRNKELWLRELAERYTMSPDQMTTLYYNCSMDSDMLRRYLDGETHLLWSNDEDILITGSQQEAAIRALSKYKGAANVNTRLQFLREIDRLQMRP